MPRLTATILCGVLAANVASSTHAQVQPEDSLVRKFMEARNLDQRHGAWFREYQVDPLSDSVRVHQWLNWPVNSSLTGMRQPMSVALTFMCPGKERVFYLSGYDSTWHFPESDSWIRYRVDQNTPSSWQQGKSRGVGQLMFHVLDSAQSARLLNEIILGQQKIVIRVRRGLSGPEEDFYYLINGFHAAYLECQGTQKQ